MIEINKKIPHFCLRNQNKEKICDTDLIGTWLVLYFYPKDNTPGCTLEARNFSYYEKEFDSLNAKVLGVSPDSCESHQKFTQKHDLTVTLLSDTEHEVLKQFNVWKPKKFMGKEFLGVIRTTYLIDPKGITRYIWNNVKVENHIQEVLEKLKELQQEPGDTK
ncbi:MAG: thioredoxin-dependent thiol peroxidase [Thermoplasmatota archaeon]